MKISIDIYNFGPHTIESWLHVLVLYAMCSREVERGSLSIDYSENNIQNRCHPSPWCVCVYVFFEQKAPQPSSQPTNNTQKHIHALTLFRMSFSRSYTHPPSLGSHKHTLKKHTLEKNIIFSVYSIEEPNAVYAVLLMFFKWCLYGEKYTNSGGGGDDDSSSSNSKNADDTHVVRFVFPRYTPPPPPPPRHRYIRWNIRRWLKRRSKSKIYRQESIHIHVRTLDECISLEKRPTPYALLYMGLSIAAAGGLGFLLCMCIMCLYAYTHPACHLSNVKQRQEQNFKQKVILLFCSFIVRCISCRCAKYNQTNQPVSLPFS